ncbi:hypothetical protein JCM10450v2_002308 [Rhodotorula kratochvilovae]
MPNAATLPTPAFTTSNPWQDYATYLHNLARIRLKSNHNARIIALICLLAYSIVINTVHFLGHWAACRKAHKPVWFARRVAAPGSTRSYILLNQSTSYTVCNIVVSILWLLYVVYLRALWNGQTSSSWVGIYIYTLDFHLALAFIPLFLITFLLISAGNLTTLGRARDGEARHLFGPWTVNALLLVVFPALFALAFIPSLVAGHSWSKYVTLLTEQAAHAGASAASFAATGDTSEVAQQAAVAAITSNLYNVVYPPRVRSLDLQHTARICEIPSFAGLLLINLLGFVFIIRHVRQDRRGQLVFAGVSVVAPLAAVPPASFGAAADDQREEPILPLHAPGEMKGLVLVGEKGAYLNRSVEERGAEGTRPSWDITINYFCVLPITALLLSFLAWVVSIYAFVPAFTQPTIVEIAATSSVWAYTLFSAATQTAIVVKRAFFARPLAPPPGLAENPFNTRTRRRRSSALSQEEDEQECKRAAAKTEGARRSSVASSLSSEAAGSAPEDDKKVELEGAEPSLRSVASRLESGEGTSSSSAEER